MNSLNAIRSLCPNMYNSMHTKCAVYKTYILRAVVKNALNGLIFNVLDTKNLYFNNSIVLKFENQKFKFCGKNSKTCILIVTGGSYE